MTRLFMIAAIALLLPGMAFAGNKTYTFAPFESVSVSAGISADIKIGTPQSVIAETDSDNFDDLSVSLDGSVLRIGRPPGNWFAFHHPSYSVHIVVPKLYSLAASSGAWKRHHATAGGSYSCSEIPLLMLVVPVSG